MIVLAIAAVGLYFVWPQLVSLFSQVPRLRSISWFWFVLIAVLVAGSFACDWGLTRLALTERSWFLIGTTQLTSNAVSKVIPGGAAVGATMSFEMLERRGVPSERIVSGLTATTLISAAVLLSLPVLSLPAILFGGVSVSRTLLQAALRLHIRTDRRPATLPGLLQWLPTPWRPTCSTGDGTAGRLRAPGEAGGLGHRVRSLPSPCLVLGRAALARTLQEENQSLSARTAMCGVTHARSSDSNDARSSFLRRPYSRASPRHQTATTARRSGST